MVSKNQIKLINSLQQKKYRKQHQMFVAESIKVIQEFLDAQFELVYLFSTSEKIFTNYYPVFISEQDMKKITTLNTPSNCLAVFKTKPEIELSLEGLNLCLDDVRDPGNLGTIIRLCDWFGIKNLICSEETVDCYNPKVIQSTMGSLARVNIYYKNLKTILSSTNLPVIGTFMEGENIYNSKLPNEGIIIMGNEANGISNEIENLVTQKISIPQFGEIQETESLNVATATAIILSEFKRR